MRQLTNPTMRPSSLSSLTRSLREPAMAAVLIIGSLLGNVNPSAYAQSVQPPVEIDPPLALNPAINVGPALESPPSKNSTDDSHLHPASSTSSTTTRPSTTDQRVQQIKTENRVEAIRNRIDLLNDILARQKSEAEAAQRALKTLAHPPESNSSMRITPTVTTPTNLATATPTSDSLAGINPDSNTNSSSHPNSNSDSDPTSKSTTDVGKPVLSTPVNSFELANSLFATGNYAEALKSYEALLKNENLPEDADWIKCLAANCYRIQGEFSTAERLYREVAASKNKSYPADHSIWFLDHLSRRKRIEADLRAIDGELQSLLPPAKK